jgi:hypothetical protein
VRKSEAANAAPLPRPKEPPSPAFFKLTPLDFTKLNHDLFLSLSPPESPIVLKSEIFKIGNLSFSKIWSAFIKKECVFMSSE